MKSQGTGGGHSKGRKIGRNKVKCERYALMGRREKNKAAKMARITAGFNPKKEKGKKKEEIV